MYVAPLIALALYWQAQRSAQGPTAWQTLASVVEGRTSYLRPVGAAFLFATVAFSAAVGVRGGVAFFVGCAMAVFAAALSYVAPKPPTEVGADGLTSAAGIWSQATSIALAPAALSAGCIGALAWFFADPSGVVVMAAFAAGTSAGALFLGLSIVEPEVAIFPERDTSMQRALSRSATGALHSHLPAVAAVLMVAATAEPEALLSLGGLLAETETLRSELMLLPIGISVLSPVLTLIASPFVASLLERRRFVALFDVERIAAMLAGFMIVTVVMMSGLAWAVAASFAVGIVARQLAVVADEIASRSVRRTVGMFVPAALAAGAVVGSEHLAGAYGVALAALGATATFASAAACATARELSSAKNLLASRPGDVADSTVTVITTLALLVAIAPVAVAESMRRGDPWMMVATAAPVLLFGVLAGSACASALADRYARSDDEAEAVSKASRAVAIAIGAPVLAGIALGAGAAVGVALGFMAWAAASAPLAAGSGGDTSTREGMPRTMLLAWGRTMALAALVGVPIMR